MVNKEGKKKGILIAIIVLVAAALIIAAGVIISKGKQENNEDEIDGTEIAAVEHKIEYGKDIKNETLSINTNDGEKEANVADLEPEVDTMSVGKTEHEIEIEESTYEVIVTVEDTQKPKIKGVKKEIELKGEKVNVEKELKKLITAEDPIDGKLKVDFEIKEDKKKKGQFNVKTIATDENNNKTIESFVVIVDEPKEEKKTKEETKDKDKKKESNDNKSTSSNSNKNTSDNSSKKESNDNKTQTKPKKESKPKPKPESKPKPKPKPKPENKPKPKPKPEPEQPSTSEKLNKPGSLPGGGTIIKEHASQHEYSTSRKLSGGGTVTNIVVSTVDGKTVDLRGKDKSGNNFTSVYLINQEVIAHSGGGRPDITEEALYDLYDIAESIVAAYGL